MINKLVDKVLKFEDKYGNKILGTCFSMSIIGCIFWKLENFKIGSFLTLIPLLIMYIMGMSNLLLLIIYLISELYKHIKKGGKLNDDRNSISRN
jgi:hypothetical protein